tara:strand:+ start:1943 stop:2182 length:240 start_codon:yes stop_codon:yes gene_type:complete
MNDTEWRTHCKGLLSDVIAEYLNADRMTPNDLIGDIKEEVDSWMEYHKGQYVKASSIYDKLQPFGGRQCGFDQEQSIIS